ncbi:LytTR family DNA-binding domain-containing protein [Neobacillus novalis]|uniref:LytTR family DNA-binding domain-containing protein n=1 Tax=Neobacillus novalis TaxID=220687 RepID=A0AA95MLV6_9BACI|nr:LytTR family DNA-binding domain-containing protein [Neobacillus novalis]WHY86086.1 LytTR family DNA-binding domain-containing protein [Neobacillus novalis]
MKNLKVMIADDDFSSKRLLDHYIQLFPGYVLAGEASSGEELMELVRKQQPDIVLVDINMPGINGIEAAQLCKEMVPSLQVIFTTGYDGFAVEAFNLSAVDYIVKPIEKVRLLIALEKAKIGLRLHKRLEAKQGASAHNKLAIRSNQAFVYLAMEDIVYVEKEGRKSIIHLEAEQVESSDSLQDIAKRLPNYFYRTHRSYVVNLRKIVKIEAFGETYLAHFANSEKTAHISKLQIQAVHRLIGK